MRTSESWFLRRGVTGVPGCCSGRAEWLHPAKARWPLISSAHEPRGTEVAGPCIMQT